MNSLGDAADAAFTDKATGEAVSTTWNSLDQDTRNLFKGSADGLLTIGTAGLGGAFTSAGTKTVEATVVVTAKKSGKLFAKIDDVYGASKLAEAAKGTVKVGDNVASGALKIFKADEAIKHFDKHSSELMAAMGKNSYNLKEYIKDANHVISKGSYVPELNAYVKLIGGKGSAKYAFVGLDETSGNITTFHVKTVSELIKKAPSLGLKK